MRREDYLPWFEELVQKVTSLPTYKVGTGVGHMDMNTGQVDYAYYIPRYEEVAAREWATEAEAALASVFPDGHPTRRSWERILNTPDESFGELTFGLIGVFKGAANQVRSGRLGSLVDSVRLESEAELLDQAGILVRLEYLAAAAVIAGGSLENHLRHLVDKRGLTITAAYGSISTYNQAIATARKNGNEIYSKADHDQVESWGKTRNEAAHNPGEFRCSKEQVQLMIEGVRQFISRVS